MKLLIQIDSTTLFSGTKDMVWCVLVNLGRYSQNDRHFKPTCANARRSTLTALELLPKDGKR